MLETPPFYQRLERLRERLDQLEVSALLINHIINVRYLTGFTGSAAYGLITSQQAVFITDGRYDQQAHQEVAPPWQVVIQGQVKWSQFIVEQMRGLNAKRWGVESDHLTVTQLGLLREAAGEELEFVAQKELVEPLRVCKDQTEIERMGQAGLITAQVFTEFVALLRSGTSERAAARLLRMMLWEAGALDEAFPSIVLFGPRTALPHGRPGDTTLKQGDLVLVDCGALWQGYCADMTRTAVFGQAPDREQSERHAAVLVAQRAAVAAARSGMTGKELDAVARTALKEAGCEAAFSHGAGHGLGLEIHEAPRVSPLSETVLPEGATITIEPGIYFPGWGGIRIEDSVILSPEGCEELTPASHDLLIAG